MHEKSDISTYRNTEENSFFQHKVLQVKTDISA